MRSSCAPAPSEAEIRVRLRVLLLEREREREWVDAFWERGIKLMVFDFVRFG